MIELAAMKPRDKVLCLWRGLRSTLVTAAAFTMSWGRIYDDRGWLDARRCGARDRTGGVCISIRISEAKHQPYGPQAAVVHVCEHLENHRVRGDQGAYRAPATPK
jgi:hypothetical protein